MHRGGGQGVGQRGSGNRTSRWERPYPEFESAFMGRDARNKKAAGGVGGRPRSARLFVRSCYAEACRGGCADVRLAYPLPMESMATGQATTTNMARQCKVLWPISVVRVRRTKNPSLRSSGTSSSGADSPLEHEDPAGVETPRLPAHFADRARASSSSMLTHVVLGS